MPKTFAEKYPKIYAKRRKYSKREDLKQIQKEEEIKVHVDTLPGTNTPDVEKTLRNYFSYLESYFCQFVFPDYIAAYEDKYLYAGRREAYLKKMGWTDKSNVKFPLVDTIHETYFSNTYDIDPAIKIIPETTEDMNVVNRIRPYTLWAYHKANASYIVPEIDKTAILIGVGYGRTGFNDYDDTRVVIRQDIEVTKPIRVLGPTLEYVDEFSVFFSPNSNNFYTAPKFIRDIANINDVKNKYNKYIEPNVDWSRILKYPQFLSNKDYKRIKNLSTWSYYRNNYMMFHNIETIDPKSMKANIDQSFMQENVFNIDYKKNDLVEVVEYYEDNRFCLLVNGYLLFDGANPYPFKGDPIIRTIFRQKPGSLFPSGIRHTLKPYQHNADVFLNNWIDTINAMANPAYIADKGVLGPDTPNFMKNTPRRVYERQANKNIDILRLVDPASLSSLQQGLQWFVQQAYEAIGLNSYTQGGQGKVERTAGGVQSRVQVLKTALVPFFKQKNLMLTEMMKRFIAMGLVCLPNKYKVYNEEGVFTDIELSDLENDFLFFYESKTLSSLQKLEDRQDYITALQYVKNPDTIAVLEQRLLQTFDTEPLTMEQKKETIKEQLELEKYRSDQMAKMQPQGMPLQSGVGQPTPQQPGMGQPMLPPQEIEQQPQQVPENLGDNEDIRPEMFI